MKSKLKGWKEGVLSNELRSVGGTVLKKGQTVRYRKFKTINEVVLCPHEFHYTDTDNMNLIRCTKLYIEGLPVIDLRKEHTDKK